MTPLVIDASVAVAAVGARDGFARLAGHRLVAPPLMWPEARAAVHLGLWRGRVEREDAEAAHRQLEGAPVEVLSPAELGRTAWDIAEEMGWGRTYDAEYLALARLCEGRVLTLDARLRRGGDRLGLVVAPHEL